MKKITEFSEVKKIKEEFKAFIESYGVISVAVGLVLGQAVAKVINVIVEGLLMPIIEIVLPGQRWQDAVFYLWKARIKIGPIIAALIDFFAISAVVFFFVKYILKVEYRKDNKKEAS
ncbi:MAG: MscL family protein [Candidatus Omnitrophica bacterium]|nr:MscL family protein [Candidatus Omnitrophota bacterium]